MIIRPPDWTYVKDNLGSSTPTANVGVAYTTGASNAMGSVTASGLGVLAYDVEFIRVSFANIFLAATNLSALSDIVIDKAGGTTWDTTNILIPKLLSGWAPTVNGDVGAGITYEFPLFIPKGATVGVRGQNATGSTKAGLCIITVYGGNSNPGSFWCGTRVQEIGINTATSQGTNITAASTSATFSTAASIGITDRPTMAVQYAIQGTNTNTTASNLNYFFKFLASNDAGTTSYKVGPSLFKTLSVNESGHFIHSGLIYRSMPTSTTLLAQGACSGTAQAIDCAAYVVS